MSPEIQPADPNVHCVNASVPRSTEIWAATIEADAEDALLARVLQRLLVQNAVIDTLRYETDETNRSARLEILFRAEAERARLLARRWETIVTVHRVTLCRAEVVRLRS